MYVKILSGYYKSKGEGRTEDISILQKECAPIKETIEKAEDRFFKGTIGKETFMSAKAK